MTDQKHNRGSFSGRLGFVLSAAGASVGLGNIWRFPYLAAKHGGSVFLLVYILLALTFGYTMIISETAIGRKTGQSPIGAFRMLGKGKTASFGGWVNAVIPVLIVPYYSVIGGWVCRYLAAYLSQDLSVIAGNEYFTSFITDGWSPEFWFSLFTAANLIIIYMGVENGIERVSKLMMPVLVVLAVIISVYAAFLPGALKGIQYLLVPDFSHFTWMTVVSAMGQMFYSLSIAMGILITFGSYMRKDTSIEDSTVQVEIFDTAVAILGGMMIIPAVFSFSGGDPQALKAGPSLMFETMPKIFAGMSFGRLVGIMFFTLVLFAALTSSIALTECAVSTSRDEFGWSRKKGTLVMAVIMMFLGSLSSLGFGPLSGVTILSMDFLDFFDFLTNSVMMPVAALTICMLVTKYMTVEAVEEEVRADGHPFRRKAVYMFMIRWLCPLFTLVILISSVANAFGWISL